MHHGPPILVLPNAWDVASAVIFAQAGFRAVATTSGGLANSQGYPDGQHIPLQELLPLLGRIVARVQVPITADLEAGYGQTPTEVAEVLRAVIATGVVGVNLEDAPFHGEKRLNDVEAQVRILEAARAAAVSEGVPLVINARTDVFIKQIGDPATRLNDAVLRANAYREAGADCLFVPGVEDAETIGALVQQIRGPLNVMIRPGTPSAPELAQLGVARVSTASGPFRATMALTRRMAEELLGAGTYSTFQTDTIPGPEMNRMMAGE
jgi:2-methylisocitrate lyase-like PEP mutase family enzyme